MFAAVSFLVVGVFTATALGDSLSVHRIVLKADNGDYICRVSSPGDPIQAVAMGEPDSTCAFTVIRNGDDSYSFIADNYKYIGRVYTGGINKIQAIKTTIDFSTRFEVTDYNDGKISLRSTNGNYLSRINRGTGYDLIEAAKTSADVFSRFTVMEVKIAGAEFQREQ